MFVLILLWAILAIEPMEHAPGIYILVLMALIATRLIILNRPKNNLPIGSKENP